MNINKRSVVLLYLLVYNLIHLYIYMKTAYKVIIGLLFKIKVITNATSLSN